ncbi:MAG TPA: hypothetical protein VIH57_21460 [Bacteroidales bacterium]
MILLQAAMAAGAVLLIYLGVLLVIVVPILTGLLMRFSWRIFGKQDYIKNGIPYYKDHLLYFLCLLVSIGITLLLFYLSLILFDKLNPDFGYHN